MRQFNTMLKTELKLSLRGMDMVIFAICMPVVILVVLGLMYQGRPAFEGAGYSFLEQSFGALSTIAVCAGGVMGLPLVISDYRHRKILKRYHVTPASPVLILVVHTAVYALYSLASLILIYTVGACFFGLRITGSWLHFTGAFLLVMVSMFSVGMMVGGLAPDTKTAGLIASLLYFPMLIFSGATLPYEVMPPVLQTAAGLLPLTQGIKLLKAALLGLPAEDVWLPLGIICGLALICGGLAVRFFKWE